MAAFRFRNKLLRRVSKLDFFIMVFSLLIVVFHSILDKLTSPLDIIYIIICFGYTLLLFANSIIDTPYFHLNTIRVFRMANIFIFSVVLYAVVIFII